MKSREILSAFGLNLWRSNDRWFACRPGEGPAFAEYSAKSVRELVELVVPPPPVIICPEAMKSWAEECLVAAYGEADPEALAKAAFAAYRLIPSEDSFHQGLSSRSPAIDGAPGMILVTVGGWCAYSHAFVGHAMTGR